MGFTTPHLTVKSLTESGHVRIWVYPFIADTNTYIFRDIYKGSVIRESIFINGNKYLQTNLTFFNQFDTTVSKYNIDEYFYRNNIILEMRLNDSRTYKVSDKSFNIADSLTLHIHYYQSGGLQNIFITNSKGPIGNSVEFELINDSYWTGEYNNSHDTIYESSNDGSIAMLIKGPYKKGTWLKCNLSGKIIDSIKH